MPSLIAPATINPFEVASPLPAKAEGKIKSLSGRALTFCNQTKAIRTLFNPNNAHQGIVSTVLGKTVRFAVRFFIGMAAAWIGGAVGTVWHLAGALLWSKNREERIKHLKSAGADFLRVCTLGIFTGFSYGLCPDTYFEKGDRRSDGTLARPDKDENSPITQELIPFLLLFEGVRLLIDLLFLPFLIFA